MEDLVKVTHVFKLYSYRVWPDRERVSEASTGQVSLESRYQRHLLSNIKCALMISFLHSFDLTDHFHESAAGRTD